MNKIIYILFALGLVTCKSKNDDKVEIKIKDQTLVEQVIEFEEDWESLQRYKIPQWMKDIKFGIFIHWGPNSVAELHTDWYPRWMYLDNGIMNPQTGEITKNKPHPAVSYHKEKFGNQKTFGYKDIIPM